ncbi:hypothetical protein [Streptomyces sp. NPDC050856]|uniref:hypothetical protein n=1 Tax=Streptomyces sp. NPDC050856 TaxID=3154939 RepID=UPI0033F48AEC
MAFDDAGTPGQSQPGGDGGEVSSEAVDEDVEIGQVVRADRLDPLGELATPELGEYLP